MSNTTHSSHGLSAIPHPGHSDELQIEILKSYFTCPVNAHLGKWNDQMRGFKHKSGFATIHQLRLPAFVPDAAHLYKAGRNGGKLFVLSLTQKSSTLD